MNLDQINFAPLEDIQNAWKLAFKQLLNSRPSRKLPFIFSTIAGILLVFIIPVVGLLLLGVPCYLLYTQITAIKKQAWQQFAVANNWSVADADAYAVPPGFQNVGHSTVISQVITAQIGNLICDLLTYEYTVGEGKSSHTYYFTIVRTRLAKQFPHIILDSKKKIGVRNIPAGYENLKLEGNFDNFFKLYEAKGEEVDVLSIITPDVMQTLIDANQQQDIEIWGNCLYFVGSSDQRSPTAMRNLLQSVQKLSTEIIQRANSLEYTPMPTQANPQPA